MKQPDEATSPPKKRASKVAPDQLVTPELIVHAMLHVGRWSNQTTTSRSKLFAYCHQALKSWAQQIEDSPFRETIDLRAILGHALLLKHDRTYAQLSLEDTGNAIIRLHAFVFGELREMPERQRLAAEAQQIVTSNDRISVFEAAKRVTPGKNPSNSVDRFKRALRRLREDFAGMQSPPYILELVKLLDLAIATNSKKEKSLKILPRRLIDIYTPFFRAFLAQQKREARQAAARKSHQGRKRRE